MNQIRLSVIPAAVIAVVMYVSSCTVLDAGNSQDISSGSKKVAGTIYGRNGMPDAEARVILRPNDYLADPGQTTAVARRAAVAEAFVCSTETDSDGRFVFTVDDSIPPDIYALEAVSRDGKDRLFIDSIALDSAFCASGTWLSIDTPAYTPKLAPTTQITGRVVSEYAVIAGTVQVYGLNLTGTINADGYFAIDNVPEGTVRLRIDVSNSKGHYRGVLTEYVLPDGVDSLGVIAIEAIADTVILSEEYIRDGVLFQNDISGDDMLDDNIVDDVVVEDGSGGYVFCCLILVNQAEDVKTPQITFVNNAGLVVRKRQYAVDAAASLVSFDRTAEGCYIMNVQTSKEWHDLIIKVDASGEEVWRYSGGLPGVAETPVPVEQHVGETYMIPFLRDSTPVLQMIDVATGIMLWEKEYDLPYLDGVSENDDGTFTLFGNNRTMADTLIMVEVGDSGTVITAGGIPFRTAEGDFESVKGYNEGPLVYTRAINSVENGTATVSFLNKYNRQYDLEWYIPADDILAGTLTRTGEGFVGFTIRNDDLGDGREVREIFRLSSSGAIPGRYPFTVDAGMYPGRVWPTEDGGYLVLMYKVWVDGDGVFVRSPVAYLMKMNPD